MKIRIDTFSHADINSVAEWQNYGSGDASVEKAILKFAAKHRTVKYTRPLYRVLILTKAMIKAMIKTLNNGLAIRPRSADSWTKTLKIAKEYAEHHLTYLGHIPTGGKCVLVKVNVFNYILDIEMLHKDKRLIEAIDYYEDKRQFFYEGLEFKGSQREVVATANIYLNNISKVLEPETGKFNVFKGEL